MLGWHHRLNGHEFEQTPGGSEGQEVWWGLEESDTTEHMHTHCIKFDGS